VTNIDHIREMDVMDMSSSSKHNERYKYLLNVINIFLRHACNVPLISKTGSASLQALEKLLELRTAYYRTV
jgi:hypothetical protein